MYGYKLAEVFTDSWNNKITNIEQAARFAGCGSAKQFHHRGVLKDWYSYYF
jgi:hypothetical protein